MLVAATPAKAAIARWRRYAWLSVGVLVACVLSLAPYMTSSTELVRMRNALLLLESTPTDFTWTPANIPPSFKQEPGPIDPFFADVAQKLGLAALPTDWDRALAISGHLLGSSPVLKGGAVMSDLRGTYKRIVATGDGYCGDFVDVFMAIALASGMPVRAWAFSFDGFGGDGHIWPEIWNRQLGRWQLVDIFNNYYFFETAGVPLSALEFRQALLQKSPQLKLTPLYPSARVGYIHEEKAWGYYRRGLPEWYLWWGNDLFTYDNALMVRALSVGPRSLEQLGGIVQGVALPMKLMVTDENSSKAKAIWRLRTHLLVAAWGSMLAALMAVFCWARWVHLTRQFRAEKVVGAS